MLRATGYIEVDLQKKKKKKKKIKSFILHFTHFLTVLLGRFILFYYSIEI